MIRSRTLTIKDYGKIKSKLNTSLSMNDSIIVKTLLDSNVSVGVFNENEDLIWAVLMNKTDDALYTYIVYVENGHEQEVISYLYLVDTYITEEALINISKPKVNFVQCNGNKWVRISELNRPLRQYKCFFNQSIHLHTTTSPLVEKTNVFAKKVLKDIESSNVPTIETYKDDLEWFNKFVTPYGADNYSSGVYSFPLVTDKWCKQFIRAFKDSEFAVNDIEDTEYRIPEIVLDSETELHKRLSEMFFTFISDISVILYGYAPRTLNSIQCARYGINNISTNSMHSDNDSDITAVIALNNDFVGGGTRVKLPGIGNYIDVPALPVGHCMLFRGKMELHNGLPIVEGTRNILVFWSEIK